MRTSIHQHSSSINIVATRMQNEHTSALIFYEYSSYQDAKGYFFGGRSKAYPGSATLPTMTLPWK